MAAHTGDTGLSQDEILHRIQVDVAVDTGLSHDKILHQIQIDVAFDTWDISL